MIRRKIKTNINDYELIEPIEFFLIVNSRQHCFPKQNNPSYVFSRIVRNKYGQNK